MPPFRLPCCYCACDQTFSYPSQSETVLDQMREVDSLITPNGAGADPYSTHSTPSAGRFGAEAAVVEVGQYTERQLVTMVSDRDRRIEMLERRVNELEVISRIPNWPRCYGIVYVNIDQEIPSRRRRYMKALLYGYYFTVLLLWYNCIALFIATNSADDKDFTSSSAWSQGQWVSLATGIIGPFIAFPLWFYTSYRAVSTGQTAKYFISIAGVFVGLAAAVFAIIGIIGMGFSGVIIMVSSFANKQNAVAGFVLLGGLVGWSLQGLLMLFALVWQVRYYRKDYSIAQLAKVVAKEFVSDAAKSKA